MTSIMFLLCSTLIFFIRQFYKTTRLIFAQNLRTN